MFIARQLIKNQAPLGVRCLRGQNTWKKNAAQSGENQIEIGGITLPS
jgi:hypothetical protein